MEQEIQRIRSEVALVRVRSGGRPTYPSRLRAEAVEVAAELYEAGYTQSDAARELGLNRATLGNWEQAAAPPHGEALLSVELVEEEAVAEALKPAPVVYGPLGLRIEGLDVAGIAELIQRLA